MILSRSTPPPFLGVLFSAHHDCRSSFIRLKDRVFIPFQGRAYPHVS
ncbi:unnamed protein product, partial [Protopolystoma xenopodis]